MPSIEPFSRFSLGSAQLYYVWTVWHCPSTAAAKSAGPQAFESSSARVTVEIGPIFTSLTKEAPHLSDSGGAQCQSST